ncbi:MAG: transglutaminase domain-containing protein [Clostridia bacterium]|nr:transglutaminase domain-containing protein [Clostridia bacterium]
MFRKTSYLLLFFLLITCSLFAGCGQTETSTAATPSSGKKTTSTSSKSTSAKVRDNTPQVLVPEASGDTVLGNDTVAIDVSHADEGYVMVKYTGTNSKVKFLVTTPDQTTYPYLLHPEIGYETFPLSGGNGTYQLQVYENLEGDRYSTLYSESIEVELSDEFHPFLYPNQYVWFTKDAKAIAKASSIVAKASDDLDALTMIYHFVIENITYDQAEAESVSTDYLPDIDEVLETKKGICFDYASLLAAMLRAQGIPTKLEIGYSGEAYHAWISAYLDEQGWIDNIIEFDGESWSLMDPTFAASNSAKSVGKYIGDGENYIVKYVR